MTVDRAALRTNIPTILVIFGVTGDLSQKKILPALFHLWQKNFLPERFRVVGFSRRPWNDLELRAWVGQMIKLNAGAHGRDVESFLEIFSYAEGQFEDAVAYGQLAEQLIAIDDGFGQCTNKLFYLGAPPQHYEMICRNLAHSGLTIPCGGGQVRRVTSFAKDRRITSLVNDRRITSFANDRRVTSLASDVTGWTRVLIEKPFGTDTQSAIKLDRLLALLFKEEQIFRIDHYLAKEALQNILTFRFSNTLFEPLWNHHYIEKVEIRLCEQQGINGRGEFLTRWGHCVTWDRIIYCKCWR